MTAIETPQEDLPDGQSERVLVRKTITLFERPLSHHSPHQRKGIIMLKGSKRHLLEKIVHLVFHLMYPLDLPKGGVLHLWSCW